MPKHSELNINRRNGGKPWWDQTPEKLLDPEPYDFREPNNKRWRVYVKLCVRVLRRAGGPLSVPEIHRRLGKWAYDRWTILALESVEYVFMFPRYPNDLYSYEPNVRVRAVKDLTAKDANARIFAQNGRKRLEAKV